MVKNRHVNYVVDVNIIYMTILDERAKFLSMLK